MYGHGIFRQKLQFDLWPELTSGGSHQQNLSSFDFYAYQFAGAMERLIDDATAKTNSV